LLKNWLLVLRPWSFTATIIPLSLGAALAWDEGIFDPILFFATILAGLAVHAGTNLSNTYGDYVTGVDTLESASHLQVVSGLIEAEAVKKAAYAFFAVAALIGFWLSYLRGWPVLAIGVIGLICGYCYTMGPRPYKYDGLGPIAIFFLMGPMMVWPAYYIQTGHGSWAQALASLPICCLISGFHLSNDIRDMIHDRSAGIKTLALILGIDRSMLLYYSLFRGAFLFTVILVAFGILPLMAALPLLLWPQLLNMFSFARSAVQTDDYSKLRLLEGAAAGFHFKFGSLLVVGTALQPLLHYLPR